MNSEKTGIDPPPFQFQEPFDYMDFLVPLHDGPDFFRWNGVPASSIIDSPPSREIPCGVETQSFPSPNFQVHDVNSQSRNDDGFSKVLPENQDLDAQGGMNTVNGSQDFLPMDSQAHADSSNDNGLDDLDSKIIPTEVPLSIDDYIRDNNLITNFEDIFVDMQPRILHGNSQENQGCDVQGGMNRHWHESNSKCVINGGKAASSSTSGVFPAKAMAYSHNVDLSQSHAALTNTINTLTYHNSSQSVPYLHPPIHQHPTTPSPAKILGHSRQLNQFLSPQNKRKKTSSIIKHCNCKNSQCLQLYCQCFASGELCGQNCNCRGCFNKPKFANTIVMEKKNSILDHNPLAFASNNTSSSSTPRRGCNCKMSKCMKGYCDCYKDKLGCSNTCRCETCDNTYGRRNEEPQSQQKAIVTTEAGSDRQVSHNTVVTMKNQRDGSFRDLQQPASLQLPSQASGGAFHEEVGDAMKLGMNRMLRSDCTAVIYNVRGCLGRFDSVPIGQPACQYTTPNYPPSISSHSSNCPRSSGRSEGSFGNNINAETSTTWRKENIGAVSLFDRRASLVNKEQYSL